MLMDGGGFGTITGNTFQIKQEAVTPGSAGGLTAAEIEQLFSYLPDPSLVSESGRAHTAASEVLADIADSLAKHVQVLNEAWSGTAAQAAVTGFQQLHETAIGLAQASAKTGAVLSWLGGTILPFYKNYKAPALSVIGHIEAAVGHNPSDIAAQQVMERLNNRLVQANANLPPSVSKNLPAGLGTGPAPPVSGSGSAGAGAGAAAGAVGGLAGGVSGGAAGLASGGTTGTGGGAVGSLGTVPHGSPGAPATLASAPGGSGAPGPVTPGGSGTGGGAPGPVAPGGPGSGGGTVPVLPGPPGAGGTGGGVSGEVPGGPGGPGLAGEGAGGEGMIGEGVVGVAPGDSAVIGSDGMIGVAPGDPGAMGADGAFADGAFADGAAADAAGQQAAGGTGFPVTGGAGGSRRETERDRQAWMAEDADVWEGQAETAPTRTGT